MLKEEIERIFNAGRDSGKSFEEWYAEYAKDLGFYGKPDPTSLAKFYEQCFATIAEVPAKAGLNSRKEINADLKHVLRGILKFHYKGALTYEGISKIELLAGSSSLPHHSTIINSIGNWQEGLIQRRPDMIRKATQIFNTYIL